jgi:hypothetical protein
VSTIGVALAALFVAIPVHAASVPRSVTWSSEIAGPSRNELDQALDKPREAGDEFDVSNSKTGETRKVTTCRQALELPKGFEPATDPDYIAFRGWQVVCRTIGRVVHAKPAKVNHLGTFEINDARLAELPALFSLTPSPEEYRRIQAAWAKGWSWRRWDKHVRVTERTRDGVRVESKFSNVLLRVLARGDIDGDGFEDVIVECRGGGQEGTWGATAAFVLTRRSAKGRLELIEMIE